MDAIEVSAKTVEEAITKASIELGLSSDQLDINIISEGSTGFLGLGSKPAMISVRKKVTEEDKKDAQEEEKTDSREIVKDGTPDLPKAEKASEPAVKSTREFSKSPAAEKPQAERRPEKAKREIVKERSAEEIELMEKTAENFLGEMFKAMEMPVTILTDYDAEEGVLSVVFEGENMGILIGKRGQTLDSLQYLTSMVVNKKLENYVRVKADTEDYRSRRKETLENLARNIAYKVKKTQRAVSLEAMNPYERRIIHSALQSYSSVETHSEGSEPYRHIVVSYKKG